MSEPNKEGENSEDEGVEPEIESVDFATFLESVPPSELRVVSDCIEIPTHALLHTPDIKLYCNSEVCSGMRIFRYVDQNVNLNLENESTNMYMLYQCSNCNDMYKTFSLNVKYSDIHQYKLDRVDRSGQVIKYGEIPAFGSHTPSRLIKLIGGDRDAFLKGRRCENQGLGIGAFVYYRRVVENQKDRILKEIIKVAKKLNASHDNIDKFEKAIKETQFAKAMSIAKPAMPESLLIDGHNPLALLHSALSEGVHALSDEECLQFAHSIRLVLMNLSQRLAQALKDDRELNSALGVLLNKHRKSKD